MAGLSGQVFFVLTALPVGYAANRWGLDSTLYLQAFALTGILGLPLWARERIPTKYDHVNAPPTEPAKPMA